MPSSPSVSARCLSLTLLAAAATAAAALSRADFAADLTSRGASAAATLGLPQGASLPAPAAARVLGEALAANTLRKRARLDELRAAGALGTVTVNTTYGQVVGIGGGNATVNQFLGVPFAAPPLGSLRWRAPTPPAAWSAPLDATWFQPACMQTEWYWGILSGTSEDCLNLNIYAPAAPPPPGGYPVMLFFYGGSFTYGSANFPLYDGETDVALMKDVILVASNYRLNVFGYLAGDELRAESPDGSVGAYGLQDQRAAMTFIRDEIASFGGDPTRVTILGESAGGASVANHLVSPRSFGLFHRAIIESGSFSDWTAQPYNISRTRLPQVAANLGCAGSGAPLLACMRAVNATTLLAADRGLTSAFLEWSPSIDGVEVVDDPRALLAAGKVAPGVPVMAGFNHDEGTLFNSAKSDLNASDYAPAIAKIVGPVLAPSIVAEYPPTSAETPWWAICDVLRDSQMLCPAKAMASALAAPVRTPAEPTFIYFYTQVLTLIDIVDLFKPLRCFHGSELVSVFDITLLLWTPGELDMATTFVHYWTNFAISGDPNVGATVPAWPAFASGAGDNIAAISATATAVNVTVINALQNDKCAFWAATPIPASAIWG